MFMLKTVRLNSKNEKWRQKNEGVADRAARDLESIDETKISSQALSAKAKVYESLGAYNICIHVFTGTYIASIIKPSIVGILSEQMYG